MSRGFFFCGISYHEDEEKVENIKHQGYYLHGTYNGKGKLISYHSLSEISKISEELIFLDPKEETEEEEEERLLVDQIVKKMFRLMYVGDFRNGVFEGVGSLYYIPIHLKSNMFDPGKILIYSGSWKQGAKSGFGKLYYAAKKMQLKYVGNWLDDEKSGVGKMYDSSGRMVYEGSFKKSRYWGKGKVYYSDGDKMKMYDGEFQNGVKEGFGVGVFAASGDEEERYEGGWKNGKMFGSGKYVTRTTTYEGDWKDDKKHGVIRTLMEDNLCRTEVYFMGEKIGEEGYSLKTCQDEELKNDKYFVMSIVHHDGEELQYVNPVLKKDVDVVTKAVSNSCPQSLLHADPSIFQNNKKVIMNHILPACGECIFFIHPRFLEDEKIVKLAVRQNGILLEHLNPMFQYQNKHLVSEAVKQNGLALKFCRILQQRDNNMKRLSEEEYVFYLKEIVLPAVRNNVFAIRYFQPSFRYNLSLSTSKITTIINLIIKESFKKFHEMLLVEKKGIQKEERDRLKEDFFESLIMSMISWRNFWKDHKKYLARLKSIYSNCEEELQSLRAQIRERIMESYAEVYILKPMRELSLKNEIYLGEERKLKMIFEKVFDRVFNLHSLKKDNVSVEAASSSEEIFLGFLFEDYFEKRSVRTVKIADIQKEYVKKFSTSAFTPPTPSSLNTSSSSTTTPKPYFGNLSFDSNGMMSPSSSFGGSSTPNSSATSWKKSPIILFGDSFFGDFEKRESGEEEEEEEYEGEEEEDEEEFIQKKKKDKKKKKRLRRKRKSKNTVMDEMKMMMMIGGRIHCFGYGMVFRRVRSKKMSGGVMKSIARKLSFVGGGSSSKKKKKKKKKKVFRRVFYGTFRNGLRNGNGKETSVGNGSIMFIGSYVNGRRQGKGILFTPFDGGKVIITEKNEEEEEEGEEEEEKTLRDYFPSYMPTIQYEGEFYRGVFHGRGERHDVKTGTVKTGTVERAYWKNGELDPSSKIETYECPIIKFGNQLRDQLRNSELIGSGAYGIVYKVRTSIFFSGSSKAVDVSEADNDNNDGDSDPLLILNEEMKKKEFVAVKIIKCQSPHEMRSLFRITKRGIRLSNSLRNCENVISVYAIIKGVFHIGCVMEYCSNDVQKLISASRNISSPTGSTTGKLGIKGKSDILYGTAKGMLALHKNGIMHRDLKVCSEVEKFVSQFLFNFKWPNVMISNDNVAKITDFDTLKEDVKLWKLQSVQQSSRIGTPGFLAPEVFLGKDYTLKCDVYAFGLMMYSLLFDVSIPHSTQYQCSQCGVLTETIIQSKMLDYHCANHNLRPLLVKSELDKFPKFLIDIMTSSWDNDPRKRPSFADIVHMFDSDKRKKKCYAILVLRFSFYGDERLEETATATERKPRKYNIEDQQMLLVQPKIFKIKEWINGKFSGHHHYQRCEISELVSQKTGEVLETDEDLFRLLQAEDSKYVIEVVLKKKGSSEEQGDGEEGRKEENNKEEEERFLSDVDKNSEHFWKEKYVKLKEDFDDICGKYKNLEEEVVRLRKKLSESGAFEEGEY